MPDNNGREKVFTVQALTALIKRNLEASFSNIWVEGEISGVKMANSGHVYFTLKDARSELSVVMFSFALRSVAFRLSDGLKVRVFGQISVFEARGVYQLVAKKIERVGLGDLMAQFEELKRKLQLEGLFDVSRKRALPMLPRRVGIVTSPTGAAIRDMLNVTKRRFPNLHILLAPVRVQGTGAAREITEAIRTLNSLPPDKIPDVLIVGRGGGSIEDLWAFNEEIVARAIFESAIPVISAVGHEIDHTISDFVADLRAPTPSAAAELVVGRKEEFMQRIASLRDILIRELRHAVQSRRSRLERVRSHHVFRQPQSLVRQYMQRVDLLENSMKTALNDRCQKVGRTLEMRAPQLREALLSRMAGDSRRVADCESSLRHLMELCQKDAGQGLARLKVQLEAYNPLAVLRRGYSVTRNADGSILRSVKELKLNDRVETRLSDGLFVSSVATLPGEVREGGAPQKAATARPARRRKKDDGDATQLTLF